MARIRARTLIMYTDPAHGWLRVPFGDLELLGIEDKISSYSYVAPSGTFAYLEEDSDAQLYLDAAEKAGWKVRIRERHTNRNSRIRRYPAYRSVKDGLA